MNLAIIPARSGSKRILNKNIKNFDNQPLISKTISIVIKSKLFNKVVVSTDSEKIAKISKKCGAEVPFKRPKNISDDHTRILEVIYHAVNWYKKRNINFDYVCCIYAANPFLKTNYLKKGLEKLKNSNKSFAVSVTKYNHPIQRSLTISKKGNLEANFPSNIRKRTQDLKENYHDAAQFIWATNKSISKKIEPLSSASIPIIIPKYLVQDIDDYDDFKKAEIIYKVLKKNKEI